jgi:hypothetical protein
MNVSSTAIITTSKLGYVARGGSIAASATNSTPVVSNGVRGHVTDFAVGQIATQNSTISDASKAVDGNTDGNYFDGSVTHIYDDTNAWWQVDLGPSAAVTSIVVWN